MLGDKKTVSQRVTDAVVTFAWVWLFTLLFTVPAAIWVTLYNSYRTGTVPDVGFLMNALDPTTAVIIAMAAFGVFVLVLLNITLGTANVEAAIEQGQDLKNETEDNND